jgi:hypothetical protein
MSGSIAILGSPTALRGHFGAWSERPRSSGGSVSSSGCGTDPGWRRRVVAVLTEAALGT